ncbi:hypothetical protein HYH02_000883 [Chlamydomonas schloesseri]|uniref:Protein kinase domain-containing protein n=1 Tax=Chlamydomonas schloesseri TaxID=2026947 RepID=A0A835WXP1_9CHLO|nr:hypothetical protein HYH02_000883 [Chlamydomonas schloesseri]|eukprot:KAG2455058.1 hypothetical protein HYH02_000883 [Chlamydomonas schloesseri]
MPMVLLFAWHKIELRPGITFRLQNVAIQFYVVDSPARTPNFYIFAPSQAPSVGTNTTRVVLQDSMGILGVALPVDLRKLNVLQVPRPPNEGSGPQDIDFAVPHARRVCINETLAPLLDRCWSPGRDLYRDVALPGGDVSGSDGTPIPNNVNIRILNSTMVAQFSATAECIASLGPYGCIVFTYRTVRNEPPAPISAQMAAILAQQQRAAPPGSEVPGGGAPATGQGSSSGSSSGGGGSDRSNQMAVLVGAIVGGVVGVALLVGAVAALVHSQRRRKAQQREQELGQQGKGPQPDCEVPASFESGSSLRQQLQAAQQQQQDGKANPHARYSEHIVSVASYGQRSTDTAAASPLRRDPPTLHGSDHSGRMLPDLVVRAAPLNKGLSTNLLVVTSRDDSTGTGGGGPGGESGSGAACPPALGAAAAIVSASTESRPSSGTRSCGAGSSAKAGTGGRGPSRYQREAGCGAAAAAADVPMRPAAFAMGVVGSADGGEATATAVPDGEATPTASTYAAQAAAALLARSSDVDSLLHIVNCSNLLPSSTGSSALAGGAFAPASAEAGLARGTADVPADTAAAAAMAVGGGSVGTPAAAVSVLPGNASCEAPAAAQVEVVELLPHKLGKGSFGRVVEGRYRGQRVAVKQALDLHDGLAMPVAKMIASFLQEVEVMGRCEHPNTCKLLAACLAPPKLCLVMEMMDTNLESLIYGGPPGHLLPLPKLLHIAIQVAQGLEYLHPTVYHRDLKPANVLISNPESDTPIVKLTDFGLSKITEMTVQTANPEAGTPAYMAPETFDVNNYKLTHKVDLYAFGVMLWAMLTGEEPWKGYPLVSVAFSVHCGRRPPLAELSEERCPRKLRRLIEQCWDAQPRRRPAAAEAVKELFLLQEQLQNGDAALAAPSSAVSEVAAV